MIVSCKGCEQRRQKLKQLLRSLRGRPERKQRLLKTAAFRHSLRLDLRADAHDENRMT